MNKQQIAAKIWESANQMRSKIEANEYKDYMSGKLTVLKGSEKTDYPLVAGADRLEAAGAQLPKGAKAVAVINGAGKKTLTVRYTLK